MDTVSSSHTTRTCPQARRTVRAARWRAWLVQSLVAIALALAAGSAFAQTFPDPLVNTAQITLPANTTDPAAGNNTATDSNALAVSADLSIVKTFTSASPAPAGSTVTYQIVVTNAGPSDAIGATITDTVPPQLLNVSWTCAAAGTSSCDTANGTGNVSLTADISAGAANTITITVSGTAPASGTIAANTATVTPPVGTTDPNPGDNTSTTPAVPVAAISDLSVLKTLTSASPAPAGSTVTYQIVVNNAGPSDAIGATITDTVPAELSNVSWTCAAIGTSSCGTPGGTGDVNLTANVGAGAGNTVNISVTGTAPASGTIAANTVTITPPGGTTDPVPGDNTSTTPPIPVASVSDLSVVKTLTSASPAPAGSTVTYQIVVSNAGPSDATGATITDTVPAQLSNVSWTCVAAGTASCGTPGGTGDVNLTANVAAGAGNTITINVTGTAPASGTIAANTVTITPPGGTTDPDPGDNTDTVDPVAVTPIVSIDSASAIEGDAVVFTVSLSGPSASDVTVTLNTTDGTAVAPGDYTAQASLVVTIPAGSVTATVSVPTIEDTLFEGDETFTATIGNPVGATIGTATGTGTITDDDAQPVVSIDSASAAEGDAVVFTVSLTNPSASDVTVTLNTVNGTAVAPGDYTAQSAITVTIPAGSTSATVSVPTIEDALFEGDETFTATISNPVGATIGTASGTGTITDDDTQPVVSIDSASATEGNPVAFTVSLSGASATDVTVVLGTANGTAVAPGDYTAQAGITVTIPAGSTSVLVNVPTIDDAIFEGSETFTATLSAPTGATLGAAIGTGTITDNETAPVISITGGSAIEGSAVSFTVNLSGTSATDVTVVLDTADLSATAPGDYTAQAALLVTIPAGSTSVVVNVPTIDDAIFEGDETFTATISAPVGATLGAATATGTITDNDAVPTLSIDDVTVNEAAGTATFTVTLSAASGTAVTVDYASANGTATAGADYTATSGTLSFAPGVLTQTITVAIADDNVDEADETFTIGLSNAGGAAISDSSGLGTITDNEGTPTVSIDSASAAEGDAVVFTVSLSNPSASDVTVTLDTANGTAVAPGDYTAQSGITVTIPAGSTSATVNVPTIEDAIFEGGETFTATISNPVGATIGTASGTGTITDDEAAPALSINDVTVDESAGTATFTVTLSGASATAVTVDYATANGTATAGADYTATSGTLTFAPGTQTQTITVPITDDTTDEPNETYTVTLSNATGATIADASGLGTITDNDVRVIDAVADSAGPVPGTGGTNVVNVLLNDTLDAAPVNLAEVVLTPASNGPLTINPDGSVDVAPDTPAGTYTASYQICEAANPTNCDSAIVTITVGVAVIVATDDTAGPVVGSTGATNVVNVLANDTLGGTAPDPADVVFTPTSSGPLTINPDGSVDVAPDTPAGTYTATYQICEALNPTNCDTASVTVTVVAAPIAANDDTGMVASGAAGGTAVANVLANDTVGSATATVSSVVLTQQSSSHANVALDTASGAVRVAAGTPAGTYTLTYQICEALNPANCDTALVTVTVAAAAIVANDDSAGPVPGLTGGTNVVNVLANDTLGGAAIDPANVVFTPTSSSPLTIHPDGSVDVVPNTPAGTYTATYQICERLNPANCDSASVTVTVAAAVIVANDDGAGPVPGSTGGSNVINVFANDTLDGAALDPTDVVLTPTSSAPLTIHPDGSVDVAPNTPAGTYTATYQICERLNPANCDTAMVTITVAAAPIDAIDDDATATPVSGSNGGMALGSVLPNDTLDGAATSTSNVLLSFVSATHPGITLDTGTAQIRVAPNTPAGTYTLTYRICEVLNPTNCDTAVVTLAVAAAVIDAIDDTASVDGATGGNAVINVLGNDRVDGGAVNPATITLTSTPTRQLTIRADGSLDVAPNTSAGTYTIAYRICENLNPGNCDTAIATVTVTGEVAALRITKRALQRTTKVGELVRYTITADNVSPVNATAMNLVDAIPAGFTYVDGSLAVDDDDNGGNLAGTRPLTVAGIDLAPGRQATISYYLRVGAGVGPGIHTNRAVMQDMSGQAASNVATADVEVAGDPLFDDSLILGTVFDDRNGNGIQQAGERGVPGVRIASIEGLIAETDAFGRYHLVGIPAGSSSRGRLFILKVDPATLPAGTTFTTENPRVRRITPGLPVRFDFGVKLPEAAMEGGSKQVDIELGEVIFARNSAEIPADSGEMLDRIAETVRKHGGGRISIAARGAAETLAFQRAQAVQAELGRRLGADIASKTRIDVTTEVEPLEPLISLDRAIGLSRLLFDTDKAEIRPQYRDLIRHIAQAINERGHGELRINGYADARGDVDYNMDLSQRRARAVFDAIARELRPEVRERLRVDITTPSGAAVGAGRR